MKEKRIIDLAIKNGKTAVDTYRGTRRRIFNDKLTPENLTLLGASLLTLNVLFATNPDILPEPAATIGYVLSQRQFPLNAIGIASGVYTGSTLLNSGVRRIIDESLPYYKACSGLVFEDVQANILNMREFMRSRVLLKD